MNTTDTPDVVATNAQHGALVLIRGLPGSGKSYLATALHKSLGADGSVVLDPDMTDPSSQEYVDFCAGLRAEGVDEKFYPYRFLRSKAYQAITNHQVILWNQAFTNLDGFNKTIINLQAYAAEHGTQLPVLVVEVEVDHDVARQRVTNREQSGGHGVPQEAFARFVNDYTSFSGQGYNIVTVRGQDDIAPSVAAVKTALQALVAT